MLPRIGRDREELTITVARPGRRLLRSGRRRGGSLPDLLDHDLQRAGRRDGQQCRDEAAEQAADRRHVPLRTIVVTVAVVAATYLAGKLIYRLRDIVLLMIVAGFVALLLNPLVILLQRRIPRRGYAVAIVTLGALVVFAVLAYSFGNPLVNGITNLADRLPVYVASAQHGQGWIGHIATKYHIQAWVQKNAPKLVTYAESLSEPVLTVGKGALSLLIELFTIFILVLLLLLEGPKMRTWLLGQMRRRNDPAGSTAARSGRCADPGCGSCTGSARRS